MFLADLLEHSPKLRALAAAGELVYDLNHDLYVLQEAAKASLAPDAIKDMAWNMDLVLGRPPGEPAPTKRRPPAPKFLPPALIRRAAPDYDDIWMVLDAKGVMTEHGKARRNRQRDLTALWAVMHTFFPKVVVGAIIPINIAQRFRSPLRSAISHHRDIKKVVGDTLSIFRAVQRAPAAGGTGIEGVGSSSSTMRTRRDHVPGS